MGEPTLDNTVDPHARIYERSHPPDGIRQRTRRAIRPWIPRSILRSIRRARRLDGPDARADAQSLIKVRLHLDRRR